MTQTTPVKKRCDIEKLLSARKRKPRQDECRSDKCRGHGDNVKGGANNPSADRFDGQSHFLVTHTEIAAINGCVRYAVERKH